MLDVYVESRSNFSRMKGYKLHHMLRGLKRAGIAWRVVDRPDIADPAAAAFMHVDLTDLPKGFRSVGERYPRCINGQAVTIDRRLYSSLRIMLDDPYDGPVIVKTVLNSRGFPELRYRSRAGLMSRLDHYARRLTVRNYKDLTCPQYRVFASREAVPAALWEDERLIVERFAPGTLALPVVKYRLDFFLDLEINTRSTFASTLCDPETIETVDIVADVPDEVRRVRNDLHLDFGAIDYFVMDDDGFVIDANKTVTMTDSWIARFPAIARHADDVTARLIDFVVGR